MGWGLVVFLRDISMYAVKMQSTKNDKVQQQEITWLLFTTTSIQLTMQHKIVLVMRHTKNKTKN